MLSDPVIHTAKHSAQIYLVPQVTERIPLLFVHKVHVDAGKEDCYYQYVHEGATLYVSQQVLKGRSVIQFALVVTFYQRNIRFFVEKHNSELHYTD